MNSIFSFAKSINLYGILCVLGAVISLSILLVMAKKKGFEFFDFSLILIITLVSAFVGAKLLFLIVSWDMVVEIFKQYSFFDAFLSVLSGGFVFYGGLIGGFLGLLITTTIRKESVFKYTNLFAVVLPLGHAFGRVGCFFAGCCYGMEYDGFLSYTYTKAVDSSTPLNVPLLPIQLIEAVCLFVLFVVLILIYFKIEKKGNLTTWIYILSYCIIRFILEFFRGDKERGVFLSLSTSQWISILIFAVVLVIFVVKFFKKKTKNSET